MSFLRMPTAGTPYNLYETARSVLGFFESEKVIQRYREILKSYLNVENLLLVNSGTTACYILFELFKKIRKSEKQNEIILPAYTAPSLLLPIKAANLKAVLVDTNPNDFNMDTKQIPNLISSRTLAVMPVHMFGLPCEVESLLKLTDGSDIFILEDGASALGTTVNKQHIGTTAPFGFYSLNRGKNVSTLAGGIIVWKNDDYSELFQQYVNELTTLSTLAKFIMFLKFIGLSLAVRPFTYTLMSPIVSKFKYTTLHSHFDSFKYTTMQAALGINIWKRIDDLTERRIENGKALLNVFKNRNGIITPVIPEDAEAAFNQFPIVIDDLKKRKRLQKELLNQGIETTLMYEKPLHHIFPELYSPGDDPFPNATYLAEHLLLIPPHAQIRCSTINTIKEAVKAVF
ncbi:MAG: DegT/DnrJ/EryC1/StrS family aminotransferase [Candidatus Marinimicrobia bacterium]|nr:DegT/DnrJ/EryC1/StrS family aminotransferase [Candidatus Neomarinimicrobiota bacterium]